MSIEPERAPGGLTALGAPTGEGFGGFAIGEMRLALPAAQLIAAWPLPELLSLPCELPAVIGGIAAFGAVVPVIELHRGLGLAGDPPRRACVLLVQESGRLLALAVDRPLGLHQPAEGAVRREISPVHACGASWLVGSIEVPEGHLLLLSLAGLLNEPGLPSTVESERAASHGPTAEPPACSLIWFRSQGVTLAIDTQAVQDTVPAPELQASPLARGHCLGVLGAVGTGGGGLPVVDLLGLLGLGRTTPGRHSKVLRLRMGDRLIGLLVDDVLDIGRVAARDLAALPACALHRADLFAGLLAWHDPGQRAGPALTCPVLDAQALVAEAELRDLAAVSAVMTAGPPASTMPEDGADMLVYEAGGAAATPLRQVEEILPAPGAGSGLQGQAPLLGLLPHRGQGLPVFCLTHLLGRGAPAVRAPACVLVVPRADGQRIGFAVPGLSFIERATWQTSLRGAARQLSGLDTAGQGGELALFRGSAGQPERMVQVVDLAALAGRLGQHQDRPKEVSVA